MKRAVLSCCLLMSLFAIALPLLAQAPAANAPATASSPDSSKDLNDKLAQLDQRVTAAQSAGDNAWSQRVLVTFW